MKKLHVKLIRSTIKRVETQKRVVAALGLRRLNHVKIHDDNPVIRGMIYKVRHLLEVTEVDGKNINPTHLKQVSQNSTPNRLHRTNIQEGDTVELSLPKGRKNVE